MGGGTRLFQVPRRSLEVVINVKLHGLDTTERSGYGPCMGKMEVEDSTPEKDTQSDEPVRRRPYTMPVLERHDEWQLVTGMMVSPI
jgi:hypothetical protein